MIDLNPIYNMVEEIFRENGLDPEKCRGDKAGQWKFHKGSATVWIDCLVHRKGKARLFPGDVARDAAP